MSKILIISGESQFTRSLRCALSYSGFITEVAHNFNEAWNYLSQINFDLLLVDAQVKSADDAEFCKELREVELKSAIILMSECYEEYLLSKDEVDDFILRPFTMSELKIVVNKQLERKRLTAKAIVLGDLRIDVARSLVMVKNRILFLGKKETEILILMSQRAGRTVKRDKLVTDDRIRILSRKLEEAAGEALRIKTVQGFGYQLVASSS